MTLFKRPLRNEIEKNCLPLYEAKMFHQFDHHFSSYEDAKQANLNSGILPQIASEIKQNFYRTSIALFFFLILGFFN